MKKRPNLIRLIHIFGIVFILGVGTSIIAFDLVISFRDFNARSNQMRSDHIARQKQLVKQEVERVVKMIYHDKAQSEARTKNKIKSRVYDAYAIAQNIYNQNKSAKSEAEIQKMILDALRPIRFEKGSGYYFATRLNGIEVLFADKPETEGLNLLNVQDTRGRYVIKDMVTLAKKSGEGFYEYHWTKPGIEGNDFKKISFIKRFEPYDWFIGAGLYVDDIEALIKSELLSAISRIRYGKEGYIFVNRLNGDALVSNGKVITEVKKLWEVFNKNPAKTKKIFDLEYDAAVKPNGDYIYYSIIKLTDKDKESPKTSFIYGVPEWEWLVGSGVYLDDVEADILVMRKILTNQVKMKLITLIIVVAGIVCFFLLLFSRLNRMLRNDFNLFLLFFNNAALSKSIDRDLVQFEELDLMAETANRMLQDRKRVEGELWLKEERLRTLVENIPGVSYRCAFDAHWTMEFVSNNMEELTGYPVSNFIGNNVQTYASIIHAEDRQMVKETIKQKVVLKKPFIVEYRIVRSDGELRWVFEKGQGLFNDEGQLIFIDGVLIDVTERRQAEEKIIEVQHFNEEIIAKSPIGISIYDETGQCISANKSIAAIVGTTKEVVLSQNYTLLDSWQQTGLVDMAKMVLSENTAHRKEILVESTFGRSVVLDCQMVPLSAGKFRYLLLMVTDMTEHRNMQAMMIQNEKMLSVGGLAAGMAHEINNPLAGMMQTANVMNHRLTDMEISANRRIIDELGIGMNDIKTFMEKRGILRMLKTINESGERISKIVSNMLSFARKSEDRIAAYDLPELIDKTLELASTEYDFKRHYDFKLIRVKKEYEKECQMVSCEGGKIQQVLLNIFRNGAQVMQEFETENPQFIIRTRLEDKRKMVVIEIEDNGPGMDEDTRKRVFEPFFTTKPAGVGTGLGLSVSYFIITENHGGEMTVESQAGSGAKFIIRLPMEKIE